MLLADEGQEEQRDGQQQDDRCGHANILASGQPPTKRQQALLQDEPSQEVAKK